mmetsp:Transcript_10379/g.26737  ORF Transcript_10379/g.26737 Transcript_10379/m.26737 type:complete len:212 (-) Transcript_10379:6-641(-)
MPSCWKPSRSYSRRAPSLPSRTFKKSLFSPTRWQRSTQPRTSAWPTPELRASDATHKLKSTGCGVMHDAFRTASASSAHISTKPSSLPCSSSATSCACRHQSQGVIRCSMSNASRRIVTNRVVDCTTEDATNELDVANVASCATKASWTSTASGSRSLRSASRTEFVGAESSTPERPEARLRGWTERRGSTAHPSMTKDANSMPTQSRASG